MAAKLGNLPAGFDRWNLSDCMGRTVAHDAAESASLPEDVPDSVLGFADKDGVSVADVILEHRSKQPKKLLDRARALVGEKRASPAP
jgi:hypothetical protein